LKISVCVLKTDVVCAIMGHFFLRAIMFWDVYFIFWFVAKQILGRVISLKHFVWFVTICLYLEFRISSKLEIGNYEFKFFNFI